MSSADPPPGAADRALAALRRHEQDRPPEDAEPSRYELLEELGRGAMGTVHRARDRETDRVVALKLLDPAAATQREALARFRREAEALARLSHPHIVRVLDLLESPPAIVLELVEGRSLAQHLEAGRLDRAARLRLLEQVARALHHAHALGVVHRDLKPSNILVTDALEAKVADFGIAHLAGEPSALTASTAFLGTPAYMAPEQAAGTARRVDARTDVHALGVVLYELLTGHLPYRGESAADLLLGIIERPPAPPRRLDPTIPAALEAVALRALEKQPERRYQTALELADALARARSGAQVSARRGPLAPLLGLGAAVALVAVAAGLGASRSPPPPAPPRAAPAPAAGPDLEARLRAGDLTALDAVAAVASGAELLDGLARDAAVLPLEALRRATPGAHARCRAPLAVLEAVALLVGGEPLAGARARLKGVEARGLALTLFDVAGGVEVVRQRIAEEREHLAFRSRGVVDQDALQPLARLSARPDLLAAAAAPLGSECRTDLVTRMTLGAPALEEALVQATCLEPVLDRLPPALAAVWATGAKRWDLASRLARTLEPRDRLIAGHCAATVFLRRDGALEDPDRAFAEATLGQFLDGWTSGDHEEYAFAQRTLYLVSREVTRRALREVRERPAAERGPALERARLAGRDALARSGCAVTARESSQDAHRLAGLAVLQGDPEGARHTESLHPDDPLAHSLPTEPRALEALATDLLDRERTPFVAVCAALALRARARALRGDAAGATSDDRRLDALQHEDAWLDREVAERLVR